MQDGKGMMFDKILVVCVGNICRSPIGERLLKRQAKDKTITSAGLNAVVGSSADSAAIKVARENDLSLEGHVAKQLTAQLCRENDLILVMEKKHFDLICKLAPEVRGKVMLYAYWLDKRDIPDPYRRDADVFKHVYNLLDMSTRKWVEAFNR